MPQFYFMWPKSLANLSKSSASKTTRDGRIAGAMTKSQNFLQTLIGCILCNIFNQQYIDFSLWGFPLRTSRLTFRWNMLLQTWTWISLKFPSRFLTKSLFHPLQEWRVYHSLFPWSLILHFSQATQQIWNHNTTSTLGEYVFHFNIFLDLLASLEEPFVTHSVMVSQTSSLSDPTADLTFRSNIYQMSQTFFRCHRHCDIDICH